MNRDDLDALPLNPSSERLLSDILRARPVKRRTLLKTALSALAAGFFGGVRAERLWAHNRRSPGRGLRFREIPHERTPTHRVPEGYRSQVLLRWGDPILPGAPAFDPLAQSAAAQAGQLGYNHDFLAYMPLPRGSLNSGHGLLCINHEYTTPHQMFPGVDAKRFLEELSRERVDVEIAAHGHSIVEIKRSGTNWSLVAGSRYNRRLTAYTPMRIAGPAAGHPRLRTTADPSGVQAFGTMGNCAGGWTPWGTVLIAEENFQGFFWGDGSKTPEAANHARYGVGAGDPWQCWGRFYDRFHVEKEPNEANRYGWIVEYDPYDPRSTPVKRTGLGRFKHEGATSALAADGRLVIYMGDDQPNEYLYKFVSRRPMIPGDLDANRDLLDDGVLYAARFSDDYSVRWLPLVFAEGKLVAAHGFASQADVLIDTRRAADAAGATPLDRPEDVEENPVTGRVYLALTNNTKREAGKTDKANPRANNRHGQILELVLPEIGGLPDHGALEHAWDVFLLAGDPRAGVGARYATAPSEHGWLSCPDNLSFDPAGNIWIATDGQYDVGFADALYAAEVAGPRRGETRHFFNAPTGAEVCGPIFTPDGSTLFLSVQHPGDGKGTSFDSPATRWPDFDPHLPPRSAVVAVTRKGGGAVGS